MLILKNNDENKKIIMTVGMCVFNSKDIIYLALESLKNQEKIDFYWELIIVEEYNESLDLIKEYVNKLPNCIRIIYISLDKKICIGNKIEIISKYISNTSKIYVIQDADDYSPKYRLYTHFQHFKSKKCYISTQKYGIFINLKTGQKMIYDKYSIVKKKNIFINNAIKIEDLLSIINLNILKNLKKNLFTNIYKYLHKYKNIKPDNIFLDTTLYKNNWKTGFFTDGYNNITTLRSSIYNYIYSHKYKKKHKNNKLLVKYSKNFNNINNKKYDYVLDIPMYILLFIMDKYYIDS